jgi:phytoene desaturase
MKAVIVGSGFGGLSLGLRLQAMGFDTTILEALDQPGGRARVLKKDGFVFDMGPTVITVPHFIEELFALKRGDGAMQSPDFPSAVLQTYEAQKKKMADLKIADVMSANEKNEKNEKNENAMFAYKPNLEHTSRYCEIVPLSPFYRIWFHDRTFFDYDGNHGNTLNQIRQLAPEDEQGYLAFHDAAQAIFERGFLELGYTYFDDIPSMLEIVPELLKLNAVRTLFSFASSYFKSDKMRQVFSFETLLVGGSPMRVPAIYAMIHFVEKTWGIHYVKGGTGALVKGFVKKFEELGGKLLLNAPVEEILVEGGGPGFRLPWQTVRATGVRLESGEVYKADLVASNADITNTYLNLVPKKALLWNSPVRYQNMAQSMSLVVIYFGFRAEGLDLDLRHHNVILSKRYEDLLNDIFEYKHLPEDFSQYLHLPTLTDPSLAPPGCHAAYTLIPVPHQASGLDWRVKGPELTHKVLQFLEDENYIPNLQERLVSVSSITPIDFETDLRSYLGNAFGVEPVLTQSAFFRPHNRSEDVSALYCVGAGTQPGAGTPSVMMSAKMTARAIEVDFLSASK